MQATSVTTDTSGAVTSRTRYKPFGEVYTTYGSETSGTLNTEHKFTGQIFDTGTDLYFYNARYYDRVTRRFTQADTIVQSLGDPQALNRFSYVKNNPLKFIDPSGQTDCAPGSCGGEKVFSVGAVPAGWNPIAWALFSGRITAQDVQSASSVTTTITIPSVPVVFIARAGGGAPIDGKAVGRAQGSQQAGQGDLGASVTVVNNNLTGTSSITATVSGTISAPINGGVRVAGTVTVRTGLGNVTLRTVGIDGIPPTFGIEGVEIQGNPTSIGITFGTPQISSYGTVAGFQFNLTNLSVDIKHQYMIPIFNIPFTRSHALSPASYTATVVITR